MTDMIERVARAIGQASGMGDDQEVYPIHLECATAALKAIREPTEEMEEAGFTVWVQCDKANRGGCEDIFKAMMDTALKTEEPKT